MKKNSLRLFRIITIVMMALEAVNIFCFKSDLNAQPALSFPNFQNTISCIFPADIYISNQNTIAKFDSQGNINWSKHTNAGYKLKYADGYLYCYTGGELMKMDPAGNVLWNKIISSTGDITDVIINGNRVFVVLQFTTVWAYDPGLTTIDTSGNYINFWTIQTGLGMGFGRGISDSNGGAWIAFLDGGAFISYASYRMDSNGFMDTTETIHYISGGRLSISVTDIHSRSDSSHYILGNEYDGDSSEAYIRWQTNDGNNFSKMHLKSTNPDFNFDIYASAMDSLDNLYLIGKANYNPQQLHFICKMDPAGNIVVAKAWTNTALQGYGMSVSPYETRMGIINNKIYVSCSINSSLAFVCLDSTLNSTCYGPDQNIQMNTSMTPTGSGFPPLSPDYPGSSIFNAVNNISDSLLTDGITVCQTSGMDVIISDEVALFPNPVKDVLFIQGIFENTELKLYLVTGNEIQTGFNRNGSKSQADVSELTPGLYYIRGNNMTKSFVKIH